jgi:hypothetical protein
MTAGDAAARAAGREALVAAGVAAEETRPDALLPLAGRSADLDLAIVERLSGVPSPAHAAALRTLATAAEARGWKSVAKDARRALYRFGQRGIAVPPAPPPPPTAPRIQAPTLEGYLSPIDGRGDRLVWLVRPKPEGGLLVMTAVLNEPDGLREVALAEMPRKTLRRMTQDLQTRHRLRLVQADGLHCDALLAEGFARARVAGTPRVGEYPALRARLVPTEPVAPTPPLDVQTHLPSVPETAASAAALLDQPEFATWLLERGTLQPYLTEVADARESPLLLSPTQQDERIRGIVTRALREIFSGATATAYRRRLEEMAYYLHATGRQDLAAAAAAGAAALATSAHGGEGVAFCEELTRRSFATLTAADAARARTEAEGSLIVRPSAAPPRPPRR